MYSNFNSNRRPLMFRIMPILMVVGVIFIVITMFLNQGNKVVVVNCKVLDKQQQQLISSADGNMSTTYRYIVVTDKETFVCENSMLNFKFNNSDIFWRIQKDSTYTFEVAGLGKTMITEYRNILKIIR